jgi:nicotinamidase-related amidase
MAMQLADLIDPAHTAVVVSEMQRGIVGDLAAPLMQSQAADIRDRGMIDALRRLIDGTRSNEARVVHATLQFRRDRVGVAVNTPLIAHMLKDPNYLLIGSADVEVMPDLDLREEDIVAARIHGMSAFTGTELDPILRSMDIRTIIIGGISLNEAIIGMAIEAVNIGYRVVIARDAAAGFPQSFEDDMYNHVFSLLAKISTVDEILAAWER